MASHPPPRGVQTYAVSLFIPFTTHGPPAQLQHAHGRRSQSPHSFREARANSERLNLYMAEAGQLETRFSPPWEAVPAGLYSLRVLAHTAPSSHPTCRKEYREEQGSNAKGRRMGGAGDTGQSWNCPAFLRRYCRKPDLISSAIHRSAGYNDVKSSSLVCQIHAEISRN